MLREGMSHQAGQHEWELLVNAKVGGGAHASLGEGLKDERGLHSTHGRAPVLALYIDS